MVRGSTVLSEPGSQSAVGQASFGQRWPGLSWPGSKSVRTRIVGNVKKPQSSLLTAYLLFCARAHRCITRSLESMRGGEAASKPSPPEHLHVLSHGPPCHDVRAAAACLPLPLPLAAAAAAGTSSALHHCLLPCGTWSRCCCCCCLMDGSHNGLHKHGTGASTTLHSSAAKCYHLTCLKRPHHDS